MKALLNFDMDGWWALADLIKKYPPRKNDVVIKKSIPRILKLLDSLKIKSTFFSLGPDIENFPKLYREIVRRGHEIANHSYSHYHNLKKRPISEIREEIAKTHDIIEDKLGINSVGFRASNYSFNEKVLSVLEKKKYLYDSSVVPSFYPNIFPFSWLFAPTMPYRPSNRNILKKGNSKIIEIPLSVNFLRIPIMGTYTRLFGLSLLKFGLQNRVLNINFHARDFVPEMPYEKRLPFYVYYKSDKALLNTKKIINYIAKKNNASLTIADYAEKLKKRL